MEKHSEALFQNIDEIRERDFPQLEESGRVYLDTTATSQEPWSVAERMHEYRRTHMRGSNHSKNSAEAREAQEQFEDTRTKISEFFGAENFQTVFTSGTTDTSNFIGSRFPFKKEDLLIISEMEHNSQVLTARNFAKKAGAKVKYAPVNTKNWELDMNRLEKIIKSHPEGKILLNMLHVSNVTGIENQIKETRELLGDRGFLYLDMAQSAGHKKIDLSELDVDFAGVSAHKMYGPMGVGAMFINERNKRCLTNEISGGSAIEMISRYITAPSKGPAKYEPGTQDLEGIMEFGYAIDYLNGLGMENIAAHEHVLGERFFNGLSEIENLNLLGPEEYAKKSAAVIAFNIGHTMRKNYDQVARALDSKGISVRDGCFCAHMYTAELVGLPKWVHESRTAMMKMGLSKEMAKLPGAVRASLAFYNTLEETDRAIQAVREVAERKEWKKF